MENILKIVAISEPKYFPTDNFCNNFDNNLIFQPFFFCRARWHENRTIFNTPNPRLMNVSLLRDNKLLHGGERRGSRMSVRVPSRQPSMASLRPHSPNASIGKQGTQEIMHIYLH